MTDTDVHVLRCTGPGVLPGQPCHTLSKQPDGPNPTMAKLHRYATANGWSAVGTGRELCPTCTQTHGTTARLAPPQLVTAGPAPMFSQNNTGADGTSVDGRASERAAASLLTRVQARRGARVEPTRDGGAFIAWTVLRFGERDGDVVETECTITLKPLVPLGRLTQTIRADLDIIDAAPGRTRLDASAHRITTGFHSIPPAATARLVERGWVVVEAGGSVRLSLAARLALHADAHRTTTSEPIGYYRPDQAVSAGANRGGRRNGLLHNGTSRASCACGELSKYDDSRYGARIRARKHREETARLAILAGTFNV
ncbi:hypothetical protein [Streptomyces niveus]|uniref:hypothetical protein n=1 Tax=Streptomyces niveus TaxID=193462 RepID=UPI003424EC2D